MRAWIVPGVILLALVLIGRIPLGIDAAWNGEELSLAARVWLFSLPLGGKKKQKKKPAKQKKPKKEKATEEKKRRIPPLPVLKLLAENGFRTLCRIVSRFGADVLKIHFTSAFGDPAVTAMAYGAAGAAMEGLIQAGGRRIRRPDLWADVDFDGEAPLLDFRMILTIRLHSLLGAGVGFGFGVLRDFLRYKKEDK